MSKASATIKNIIDPMRRVTAKHWKRLSDYKFIAFLSVLGPSVIAANAGNEAAGIATYSSIGATYGYTLLWAFVPMLFSLIVIQEMCVRMGAVTGQGLADLIREQFGVRLTALIMTALFLANTGVVISQFIGIAQASEIFGISRYITVPIAAALMWWVVARGTQQRVERIFLLISSVFICYVFAAFMAKPDWSEVAREFVSPTIQYNQDYTFIVVALIGTTITPFMQFFSQSSTVENGMDEEDISILRADVIVGMSFATMIAVFIVISTAATLHVNGITQIDSAATAAQALAPVAGEYAKYLFAFGLLGASLLAMGVLPLATAYSISEALGFEKGLSRKFREAPIFLGIFTALIVVGAIIALIPGIPQIQLLLITQAVNGLLLPFTVVAIVKLSSSEEIMGEYRNSFAFNMIAWVIALVVSILSIILLFQAITASF